MTLARLAAAALLGAACCAAGVHAATPDISTRRGHTLAIDVNGNVYAWGNDARGQLGSGRALYRETPTPVPGIPAMASVAAGANHVLAIDNFGNVWSWGGNFAGQLGPRQGASDAKPARVTGITAAVQVAGGNAFSAALRNDGTVWTWGIVVPGTSATGPTQVQGLTGVTRIAAGRGEGYMLALKSDGTVWAWGWNNRGQLGDGTTTTRLVPQPVPGATGIIDIAAGMYSSLALKSDGTVLAWGANFPLTSPRLSPAPVAGLTNVVALAASQVSYAVRGDGTVVTWGESYAPVAFPGAPAPSPFAGIKKLAVTGVAVPGATVTSYGLDASGSLFTQGGNWVGQAGLGTTTPMVNAVTSTGFTSITHIDAGAKFGVARRGDGTVLAWGANEQGSMGDSVSSTRSYPLGVPDLPAGIVSVKAGADHSLALESNGDVWAWGSNEYSQSGSSVSTPASTPTLVSGISGVEEISAGCTHSLLRKGDGTVWTLGLLGALNATPTQVTLPTSDIIAITAGCSMSFAIRSTGSYYAWGTNNLGQLGDGTTISRPSPVEVTSIPGVTAIDVSDQHGLARTSSGAVWAWGFNMNGQLGDGTTTNRPSPAQVAGVANAVQVAAGSGFSLALLSDGTVRSWGFNQSGALGDGTLVDRTTPVTVDVPPPPPPDVSVPITKITAGFIPQAVRLGGTTYGWGRGFTGDGKFAIHTRPALVLREGAAGNLDVGKWYLDLDPPLPDKLPPAAVVRVIPVATVSGEDSAVSLSASINFRNADYGKNVGTFIFGRVTPEFLTAANVQVSPEVKPAEIAKLQKAGNTILVQLTPAGWTTVTGQLVAYTSGVINANGGANNILNGVPITSIPGAQFCIGYGESAGSMLSGQALAPVLDLEGASSSASGLPCVLSGVYVSGPTTSIQGSPVNFSALVVGVSPTGTVQLRDDGFGFAGNLGSPLPLALQNEALATASFGTSALAPGLHAIGATYSGNGQNPAASSAHALGHVVSAMTTGTQTDLQGPASSIVGQSVTFTATVFGNAITGNVQFKDGGFNLGAPVPLFNNVASLSLSTLTLGGHSITAQYLGAGGNAASTSGVVSHTVYNAIASSIALSASPNPTLINTAVTLSVTVTGNSPTGTVTFRDNGTAFDTRTLSNGSATRIGGGYGPGVHTITADYEGDGNNAKVSSSAVFLEITTPPPPAPTTTAVTASANPTGLAEVVTFTATVSGLGGPSAGTVLFRDGGATIPGCGAVPIAGSTAACATNALAAGVHSISAVFSGTATREASTSGSLAHTVNAGGTLLLTANPTNVAFGGQSINTSSQPATVTLTNASGSAVTVTSLTPGPGFLVASHNCTTLAAAATCQANLVFKPIVEGPTSALLGVSYNGAGPTTVALSGTGEKSLATHYYWSILRRAPDAGGKQFWEGEAARMQSIGANINEAWFAMAQFFFFSPEYLGFNRDNNGFVTDLYTTFFNREPDGGGLAFWVGQINSGMPREVVLAQFMFSPEFAGFAQAIFGNTAARAEVDTVMDFYRGMLARLPDPDGFNAWVSAFRSAQCAGAGAGPVYGQVESISAAFAGSGEYLSKNRTNEQYVGDLYNAFLRRGGDLQGVQFWINEIAIGARSRDKVRQDFIATPEFQGRVTNIVNQGCV